MIFTVSQKDFGFYITDTLENSDGTPFDLTGYTVKFVVWPIGNPSAPLINAAATVVSAAGGTVRYLVQSTDFISTGMWYQEWQAMAGGAIIQSFPAGGNTIRVVESG